MKYFTLAKQEVGHAWGCFTFSNYNVLYLKEGKYEYDDLVKQSEEMKEELPLLYEKSGLIDEPNIVEVDGLLIKMRNEYYEK